MAATAKSSPPSKSSTARKAKSLNQARYAQKPKPAPQPPKAAVRHVILEEVLRKITCRVLEELKDPGKIQSEIILLALSEVRDLVEAVKK